MKKIFVLLLLPILLVGCTIVRIDTKEIDNIINVVLSKNNTLYNQIGKGYKYYIPRGVTYIDTNEYNEKLYSNGNYYYLYIDIVGYYYDTKTEYVEKDDVYFSKIIDFNDKKGYVEIKKIDNDYLITFDYNYAEIIAKVPYDDINEVILDATYILSTVKFNENVIKLMLDDDYFTSKEEKYSEFESTKESDNFLRIADDIETE